MTDDNVVKADWDKMKADLLAFTDVIKQTHKIISPEDVKTGKTNEAPNGDVKPYVKLEKFTIVIPIKRIKPHFPEIAFKIAADLGLGVAADNSGVLISVGGSDWEKSLSEAKKLYLTWKNEVNLHQRKMLKKIQATTE